jgi:hypothetical protein
MNWFEINLSNLCTNDISSNNRWFPTHKGGDYRKWYGNTENVINWKDNGFTLKAFPKSIIRNEEYYGRECVSWNDISSAKVAFRYVQPGSISNASGPSMYSYNRSDLMLCLGFGNSCVASNCLDILCPTIHFEVGQISLLPIIDDNSKSIIIDELVKSNISASRQDWDSFETSWDFRAHPLIQKNSLLSDVYNKWEIECHQRFNAIKANEEELNRIFINIYGLQDELTPEVEDKDVTVRLADKERDSKSLISYLIGVIMGRYSLDMDGLAYAGGIWDESKYCTYQPDDDGIVPIYSMVGMEDGLTAHIIELLKQIYGTDTYRQNIDFIAEALGKNNNESSEETLNRYLNEGFYADHLKIYKKRPIYWMFSSGKYSGFKCLIYMHRYNEDTLAQINGRYFLPESTRLKNDLDELLARIESSEGRDRIRLEKERQKLAASYIEAIEYGQVLDHMANKYIAIDLDDGVKANYDKFQGVELVTDNSMKVKKDLLVPIK